MVAVVVAVSLLHGCVSIAVAVVAVAAVAAVAVAAVLAVLF